MAEPLTPKEWRVKFQPSADRGSIPEMVAQLDAQATGHAGTASAQIKRTAVHAILGSRSPADAGLLRLALGLCGSSNPSAEEVGAQLLVPCYLLDPETVEGTLRDLADSRNWEVREWAASAAGEVLERHPDRFYPAVASWTRDESENVRRAAALAAMYAGRSRKPAIAGQALDILEGLLTDRSRYVRDNLGPFALGGGLIKHHPDLTLERMRKWVQLEDEQARWNIAMAFSAAEGAKRADAARDVLDALCKDARPSVRRAVAKAMKNIRKRRPGFLDFPCGPI